MSADKCRPVDVDGEVIRVLGGAEMDATDREMFADVVRAAKRKFTDERCELSDLPVDQCACRIHAPKPPAPEYVVVVRFPARFDSRCAGCEKPMAEGDLIARTDDGDYICGRCAS